MSITVNLPDGSKHDLDTGATGLELARNISTRLANAALAMRADGTLMDLKAPLTNGASILIITDKDPESLELIRHSTAHLLAQAVRRLFPDAKFGVGPAIEDGFYYDFLVEKFFTPDDLAEIEAEMKVIAAENFPVIREELPRDEALARFKSMGETLKAELVSEIPDDEAITVYKQGDFYDLCRGPHVHETGKLKAFKLLSAAAAYWRGDEKNASMCRIYGTAFNTQKELDEHLKRLEEAKARDHRKLGKELGLFSFHTEAPASPFFHPRGAVVYNELVKFMREHYFAEGYREVITPQVFDVSVWKTSGHYDNFRESMFFTDVEDRPFALKPMNCPGHCLIYGTERHSYRELPIRMADFGRLHRYERSGVSHGLTRVRTFCQDDGHIFCAPEQMKEEMAKMLRFVQNVYDVFGFKEVRVALATRPKKRLGSDEIWDHSEKVLAEALNEAGFEFHINPGEGAFYGPKVEFQILDALRRPWQLGTLQVDYSMPERFGLIYVKPDNTEATPVMLHRAILGSLERFMGILIEHCGGAFPTWLAPVQVIILPITDRVHDYAHEIKNRACALGLRCELDLKNEKVNAKIRGAQLQKIPYMLVIGDREAADKTVSVRHRSVGDQGVKPFEIFFEELLSEIKKRL
ncbi:MAG: threonine--tRNA ligase [Holophagales bacterium]|jgi:threonyl-tRNA synthetase|nr:threonine--tRNA ligase [Holophagales bacterium]